MVEPRRIGTTLRGKWRIDAEIARGGFATVFHATHRQGNVAAIKILHSELARNPDIRSRFQREGYAANKVGHPGVVRILDDDVTDDGAPFIVMELLEEGELLQERFQRLGGRLPLEDVLPVVDQLLDVLAAAHDKGVIHRDIKPDNIYVGNDGTVKVLDFGLARIRSAIVEHEPTRTGLLLGTPGFMAPEQAAGNPHFIDAQTDLFAVGAMMFALLSGQNAHEGNDARELIIATATKQARSLSGLVDPTIVSAEVVALIDKAIALEKRRRWASAKEMQAALRQLLSSSSPNTLPSPRAVAAHVDRRQPPSQLTPPIMTLRSVVVVVDGTKATSSVAALTPPPSTAPSTDPDPDCVPPTIATGDEDTDNDPMSERPISTPSSPAPISDGYDPSLDGPTARTLEPFVPPPSSGDQKETIDLSAPRTDLGMQKTAPLLPTFREKPEPIAVANAAVAKEATPPPKESTESPWTDPTFVVRPKRAVAQKSSGDGGGGLRRLVIVLFILFLALSIALLVFIFGGRF